MLEVQEEELHNVRTESAANAERLEERLHAEAEAMAQRVASGEQEERTAAQAGVPRRPTAATKAAEASVGWRLLEASAGGSQQPGARAEASGADMPGTPR